MSERVTADVNRYRDEQPRLGVDSLGNLDELGGRIVDAVDHQLYERELRADIHAVFVCGSFAEGSATELISDLDVRVVVDSIPEMDCEGIERELRVEVGPELVPDVCGYFDPCLASCAPSESCPSVCIWSEGE